MFYQNPEFKEEVDLSKDCHYSSLVLGAKPLFDVLENYYHEDDGKIIGIEITDASMNVFFKNKEDVIPRDITNESGGYYNNTK